MGGASPSECEELQVMELDALRSLYSEDDNEIQVLEEGGVSSVQLALEVKDAEGLVLKPAGLAAKHLPPVLLNVRLPAGYPIQQPPSFQLACVWLSRRQLTVLCELLDHTWEEYVGSPIISVWSDVISSASRQLLGLSGDGIDLKEISADGALMAESVGESCLSDSRAVCLGAGEDAMELAMDVLRHSSIRERRVFLCAHHACGICLSEKPGEDFEKLSCGHAFCRACVSDFAKLAIAEGDVLSLKCPEPSCRASLNPAVVQAAVAPEEFERFERLLLQKTLDAMPDLVYCPRCEAPVLEQGSNHLAICPQCSFSFCGLCHDGYHPGQCVTAEGRLAMLQARANGTARGGSKAAAAMAAERQAQIQKLIAEAKSVQVVKRCSKPCPTCGQAIQKSEGCNKVRCSSCQKAMCYACGVDITELSYTHFSGGLCNLFPSEELDRWAAMNRQPAPARGAGAAGVVDNGVLDMMQRMQPAVRLRVARCPRCRQRVLKEARNNHMRCWSCTTHFCFLCQAVVPKLSVHYQAGGCKQHTD